MRNLIFCVTIAVPLLVALAGCAGHQPEPEVPPTQAAATFPLKDYVAKANEYYAQRADLGKAREAFNIMAQAQKSSPKDYDAAWTLSKYAYYVAAHTDDKSASKEVFNQGIDAGEAAIALDPSKPEGHFWLGANLGGRAKLSVLDGISDTDDIKEQMQAVIKIDPDFQNGSAYMALAQIDLELPRLMGGKPEKAVEVLESGVKYGEDNAFYHYWLAKAYLAVGRKDDAKKEVAFLQQMKSDPNYQPEHDEALKMANELAAANF
jgi:tetratricopeptide (TPR) repeat protein